MNYIILRVYYSIILVTVIVVVLLVYIDIHGLVPLNVLIVPSAITASIAIIIFLFSQISGYLKENSNKTKDKLDSLIQSISISFNILSESQGRSFRKSETIRLHNNYNSLQSVSKWINQNSNLKHLNKRQKMAIKNLNKECLEYFEIIIREAFTKKKFIISESLRVSLDRKYYSIVEIYQSLVDDNYSKGFYLIIMFFIVVVISIFLFIILFKK